MTAICRASAFECGASSIAASSRVELRRPRAEAARCARAIALCSSSGGSGIGSVASLAVDRDAADSWSCDVRDEVRPCRRRVRERAPGTRRTHRSGRTRSEARGSDEQSYDSSSQTAVAAPTTRGRFALDSMQKTSPVAAGDRRSLRRSGRRSLDRRRGRATPSRTLADADVRPQFASSWSCRRPLAMPDSNLGELAERERCSLQPGRERTLEDRAAQRERARALARRRRRPRSREPPRRSRLRCVLHRRRSDRARCSSSGGAVMPR